ncbi:MAG: hypothetical protein HC906_00610 [Bacteroidales bacterium]|nr:hypothetical protein [Bacteroidales bacterium]
MKISGNTINVKFETIIDAKIHDVFPLTCPVMEYKWTNGWKCELIHCPNGYVELGCEFREIMTAPVLMGNIWGKTTWTCIKNDIVNFHRHFELKNRISTSLLTIDMIPFEDSKTKISFEIIYNAISKRGELLIMKGLTNKLEFVLSMLAMELKYYFKHNRMISTSELTIFLNRADFLTFADKYKLVLNKFAMAMMRDNDKKRFLAGKPVTKIKG